jgi:hypothetical protein
MMAAICRAFQRPAPTLTVILRRTRRGMIRINRAGRDCSEHEKVNDVGSIPETLFQRS